MSKIIWICSKKPLPENSKNKINKVCSDISPDNIYNRRPEIVVSNNVAFGIVNPTKTALIYHNNVILGLINKSDTKWYIPKSGSPIGTFALFRESKKCCEIVTDAAATRTIWYFKNEELFIASTSQRAIVRYLGAFEFNEKVVPWMLSSGTLGPDFSWDKRIRKVPPDTSIILDKFNWSLEVKSNLIKFQEKKLQSKQHEKNLRTALEDTFENLDIDYNLWRLPLSGGYDSRGILCLLKLKNKILPKTITWGLKSSEVDKKNDAFVARKLAIALNVENEYLHTDISDEPIEKIINRFLLNCEGRIDHISAYMDGFNIWKLLFENSIQGIIRGDEGFGWRKVCSQLDARTSVGLNLISDYSNLAFYSNYNLPSQNLPPKFKQKEDESISQWRDRLYHEFRLPIILAALNDLKSSYVEIINPLLSRDILNIVRNMPDNLRTEKLLFKKIVNSISPQIPYASKPAIEPKTNILRNKAMVDLIVQELSSDEARSIFPQEFLGEVLSRIQTAEYQGSCASQIKTLIKRMIPQKVISKLIIISRHNRKLDYNLLAFRIYIIVKMKKILSDKNGKYS